MLDDLFVNYMYRFVSPFRYGAEWVLASHAKARVNRVIVPWEWVKNPGTAIGDLKPGWQESVSPESLGILPSTQWQFELRNPAWEETFAFGCNNEDVVLDKLTDPKGRFFRHSGWFDVKDLEQAQLDKYKYVFVFKGSPWEAPFAHKALVERA
ncbi:MAG TPA: hypothetical protein VFD58_36605 [Blastocatellia bacterium]|nr:hypothetical protein [Blastocatellia bacterium]